MARKSQILSSAILCLCCAMAIWVFSSLNLTLVSHADATDLFGGQNPIPGWCIKTNTTCPDPGGAPATCGLAPDGLHCYMCTMTVTSWTDCAGATNFYSCVATVPPNAPYCGQIKYGDAVGGDCSGKCTDFGTNCGKQIPTTSGVACP